MRISVRLSGMLPQLYGRPRLSLSLEPGLTVAGLIDRLRQDQPAAAGLLQSAVAVVDGRHVGPDHPLEDGQEVALLLPIAGG